MSRSWALVLAGDVALYELIMRRHNQRLFRLARTTVLRDDAEAEDVMQDAYVRAFEKLDQFRGHSRFSTWLARIALYEAMARQRKGRRVVALGAEGARPEDAYQRPGDTSERRSPESDAFNSELRRALEHAVDSLPESLRLAFVARHVEDMSTVEAAEALGVSPSALKVRLHRARERLRAELERRVGIATPELFEFGGKRCDRVVARVLERIE